jgi:CHAD domain-containing protein
MEPLRLVETPERKKKRRHKKSSSPEGFYQILIDRVDHFSTTAQQVLIDSDPEAIHQTRVYSRRVQSALEVLPDELSEQVQPLRKQLRRVRRTLNGLRDSDVFMEIIEKRLGSRKNRAPYEQLREHLESRRKRALEKMDAGLKDLGLQEFPSRFIAAITDPDTSLRVDGTSLRVELSSAAREDKANEKAIELAADHWQRVDALIAEPTTFTDGEELHGLRIAIKRLRYIVELISQMKTTHSRSLITYLKNMQDAIGEWHDLEVLQITIIRFIAHPSFIRKELETSRALHSLISQLRGRMDRILVSIRPKLEGDRLDSLMKKFLSELTPSRAAAIDLPAADSDDRVSANGESTVTV